MEGAREQTNGNIHERSKLKQYRRAESWMWNREEAEGNISSEKERLRVSKLLGIVGVVVVQRIEVRLKINESRHFI